MSVLLNMDLIQLNAHLSWISCIEVGAEIAVIPLPGIPQAAAGTVWGQDTK